MRFVVGWLSRTRRWTRPQWCITLLACFGLCILVDSVRMWISLKVMPTHRALYAPRRVLANHGKLGSGTGLNNQRSALFRMCLLAQELDAHIAVQTLHWVGNHSAEFQAVPLKMHKEVWDVGVWNQRAGSVLPLMVDSAPTHWYMGNANTMFDEMFSNPKFTALNKAFALALRPSAFLEQLITQAQPSGRYGTLQPRIESDLKLYKGFWEQRVPLAKVYQAMRNSTALNHCRSGAVKMTLAVNLDDTHDVSDLALISSGAPWAELQLVQPERGRNAKFGHFSWLYGAIIDLEVAVRAEAFFVGHHSLSTFSRAVVDQRRLLMGFDPNCSFTISNLNLDQGKLQSCRDCPGCICADHGTKRIF